MRSCLAFIACGLLICVGTLIAAEGGSLELKLIDGTVVRGDPVSFNEQGVVVRLPSGSYSERVLWTKLTQDTLKALMGNPQAAKLAEPFLEVPLEVKQKARLKEIVIKPVESRVERPSPIPPLFAAFTTPAGLLILLALLVANLYAAYEVAVYRNQPAALVCAVSVFLPVLGPLVFLVMPTRSGEASTGAQEMSADQFAAAHSGASPLAEAPPAAGGFKSKITSIFQRPAAGGLTLASAGKKGAEPAATTTSHTYRRGDTTFNRRFFETQLSGFFRVVPSEAEKDLVVVIRSARADYVARRISRISANELFIQLQKGGSNEVSVPFGEITEIQVRHKDAKA